MKKKYKYLTLLVIVTLILSACSNKKSLYSDEGQVFRKIITQDAIKKLQNRFRAHKHRENRGIKNLQLNFLIFVLKNQAAYKLN